MKDLNDYNYTEEEKESFRNLDTEFGYVPPVKEDIDDDDYDDYDDRHYAKSPEPYTPIYYPPTPKPMPEGASVGNYDVPPTPFPESDSSTATPVYTPTPVADLGAPLVSEVIDFDPVEEWSISEEETKGKKEKKGKKDKALDKKAEPTPDAKKKDKKSDKDKNAAETPIKEVSSKKRYKEVKKEIAARGYVLADGERQYRKYKLNSMNNDMIVLTTRRLICINEAIQQIEINEIKGISSHYGKDIFRGKRVWSIILMIIGLAGLIVGCFAGRRIGWFNNFLAQIGIDGFMNSITLETLNAKLSWITYVIWGVALVVFCIGVNLLSRSTKKFFFITIYTAPQEAYITLKSRELNEDKVDNNINVRVSRDAYIVANTIGADVLNIKKYLQEEEERVARIRMQMETDERLRAAALLRR